MWVNEFYLFIFNAYERSLRGEGLLGFTLLNPTTSTNFNNGLQKSVCAEYSN